MILVISFAALAILIGLFWPFDFGTDIDILLLDELDDLEED